MKILKTEGCVVSGIAIDNVDIDDISEKTKQKIIEYISDNMSADFNYFKNILSDVIDLYGEYKYLYTCEQCGDSVSETKLEI